MLDLLTLANERFWDSGLPLTTTMALIICLMFFVLGPPWGK